jgi:hypothetical protein
MRDLKDLVYQIREELDLKGFFLIKEFLNEEERSKLYEFGMEDKDYQGIFQKLDNDNDNDFTRGQKKIKGKELKVLEKNIEKEFIKVFDFWIVKEFLILRSFPNGLEQDIHTDYDLSKCLNPAQYPAGCILGIQDGSKLKVEEGYLEIPKYSCLVFKGNFKHSGCSYPELNPKVFLFSFQR